jgi:peptidoglycan-associated lipoprotein
MMVRFSTLLLAAALLISAGCQRKPGYVTPVGATDVVPEYSDGGWEIISEEPATSTTYTEVPDSTVIDSWDSTPIGSDWSDGSSSTGQSFTGEDTTGSIPEPTSLIGSRDEETLAANTIYFGFDSSTIRQSEFASLNNVVAFLQNNPGARIKVEGHCDERGTSAYNLALGQRRAASAREYLINAGIDASRLSTLSWGEDRPAALGKTEADYAKNRRAEFVLVQ